MQIDRRAFARGSLAIAAAMTFPAIAQPRGTRLIVGFPPGGGADVLARALLEPMRPSLGQQSIVENRPGAGGRIAADYLRNAAPDGTTLLVTPASIITLAPHLYKSVRYELTRDFVPVAPLARLDLGIYVGPAMPTHLRTLPEVVAYLQQAEPTKRSCGITGLGSTPHLAALLLGRAAKLDWQTVPYQGDSPAIVALLGGEIAISVASLAGGIEHVRAGKLRLLALTGSERSSFAPDVPTLRQLGYDVVVADSHSVFAPRGTPDTVVASTRAALEQALSSREVTDVMQRMSLQRATAGADYAAQLKADSETWSRAAKALNLSFEG